MATMSVKPVRTKMVPPDGGWGWVVLFSALVVNFLIPGTVKSFGVLFVEFLHVFKASSTAASWMPALCYFLYNSLGPLSSILSTRYSYKTVTIVGGTFAATGMMLSYFANSVSYLYVSYGLMVGIGAGLSFPPTVYIVTSYFQKLRGFANGLCISGSAIGTIVLPPFLQYLLDCFGYRGAVLIMGAITLNTLVCGMLYDPVEQHMIEVPIEEGIDNEALTLDEPVIAEKEPPTSPTKLSITFKEVSSANDEDKIKQMQSLSELLRNTVTVIENEAPPKSEAPVKELANGTQRVNTVACHETKEKLDNKEEETAEEPKKQECRENDGEVVSKEELCKELSKEISKELSKELSKEVSKEVSKESQPEEDGKLDKLEESRLSIRKSVFIENKEETIVEKPKLDGTEKLSGKAVSETSLCWSENKESSRFFDFSVLRDPIYLVILISNSTSAISNTNFMILLPSYAISQGFDRNSSALLLSVVSALDLVGRIGGASLSDIDFVPKYYYFVCGLGTSGIALALLPMASSYKMLAFFCGLFGLSSGMYIGITTVILADMLGTEKLSSSYGISLFVNGVLQLVGPPVCGVIYESVGTYKPIFLAFGIILILGTALWAVVPLINRHTKKKLEAV